MPRHALADADTPFAQRILIGVRYPLRGAAPLTILAVAAFDLLSFFPITGLRLLVVFIGWIALYTYAIECLRHTADGFADPPELAVNTDDRTSVALILIQLTGNAIAVLAPLFLGIPGLLVSLVFAFVLPIITMSLTFDGVGAALNPLTWIAVVGRLGGDYVLLFVIVMMSSLLQAGAQYAMKDHGPTFFGTAAFYLVANYLTIYNFHLMGALIHHRHESLGYRPESEVIAEAIDPDDDMALLGHVNLIARDDIPGATDILTERLREGIAPVALHTRYRELLRVQGRLPELLVHGQIWIAALVQSHEERRALGVVQDCIDVDPAFLPDATITCGALADTAAHGGMTRLALHLALGYLRQWPGDMGAPHYGLLALRMHERQREAAEAAALGRRLLAAYPEHPLRVDIEALLDTLGTVRKVST
ncbi:MAG TPA: hypothetical protein VM621_09000 [Luteibacter sp.]|uniref:hypothetical protein n=1 Tax=Luteibacter sp. TaxID=1886636 RepID=UPI002BF32A1E|nr:hypothetical protein [Luteibacter sp.]HVI55176.1 hypothetical protein [Luteibacter sp.]